MSDLTLYTLFKFLFVERCDNKKEVQENITYMKSSVRDILYFHIVWITLILVWSLLHEQNCKMSFLISILKLLQWNLVQVVTHFISITDHF